MMGLINYKDTLEELEYHVKELCKEIDYRRIELIGRSDSDSVLCRRSDRDEELLSRDIIYNYLMLKLDEIKRNKGFLEIYGTSIDEAEKQYNEWHEMANIINGEDEE